MHQVLFGTTRAAEALIDISESRRSVYPHTVSRCISKSVEKKLICAITKLVTVAAPALVALPSACSQELRSQYRYPSSNSYLRRHIHLSSTRVAL